MDWSPLQLCGCRGREGGREASVKSISPLARFTYRAIKSELKYQFIAGVFYVHTHIHMRIYERMGVAPLIQAPRPTVVYNMYKRLVSKSS